jgi:hypothetical protein
MKGIIDQELLDLAKELSDENPEVNDERSLAQLMLEHLENPAEDAFEECEGAAYNVLDLKREEARMEAWFNHGQNQ